MAVHFGINGQRLSAAEMQALQYFVSIDDYFIVTTIPIGAVGGYFKVICTFWLVWNLVVWWQWSIL